VAERPDGIQSIDVFSQTLAELVIKIAAQTTGIYLQPEWSAKEEIDKSFAGNTQNMAWEDVGIIEYTVPTGKTLFLSGASLSIRATDPVDYDHFLYALLEIDYGIPATKLCYLGVLGGGSITFPVPRVIPAGETLKIRYRNEANVDCDIFVTAWGYEI